MSKTPIFFLSAALLCAAGMFIDDSAYNYYVILFIAPILIIVSVVHTYVREEERLWKGALWSSAWVVLMSIILYFYSGILNHLSFLMGAHVG